MECSSAQISCTIGRREITKNRVTIGRSNSIETAARTHNKHAKFIAMRKKLCASGYEEHSLQTTLVADCVKAEQQQ